MFARIDRSSESLFLHHGSTMAVLLAIVCLCVAVGVYLRPHVAQVTVVVAIVVFALIWVAVQNFGKILRGRSDHPNSGLLVILLALIYWPLTNTRATSEGIALDSAVVAMGV